MFNRTPTSPSRTKVLAISSGGGHWVQLLRLRPAFADCDVTFATVSPSYRTDLPPGTRFHTIPDASMWHKTRLLLCSLCVSWLVLRVRPDVIVSTGAAPGYFAVRTGAFLGARTIWVDSIANAEQLSLSGREAGKHVDHWLTQWPHLATADGPSYYGNVL
jgi:UDP-N-acetylglucosamine:LPS N-acetylglucosamine transferase